MTAVRNGLIRPNTPISLNYAEHDGFTFTPGAFRKLSKVPAINLLDQEIKDAQAASGFYVVSDYFDQWVRQVYPTDKADRILEVFGCPNGENGEIVDCKDKFDRFVTASHWACNTRWALMGEGLKQGLVGRQE